MRVLHLFCMNYNFGDYALAYGVKNIIRKLFSVKYFEDANIQGQEFTDYYIDLINKKYDLIIIGGGGIIHGAHWPNGWFWLIDMEKIKKIQIPFIVYGAGYNYFKDEEGIPERGVIHLKETYKNASFFSVRNDKSREKLLESTGISAEEIADPGFWLSLDYPKDQRIVQEPYIAIQLADDKSEHRYKSAEVKDLFFNSLCEILNEYNTRYRIVLVPHVYSDVDIC